MKLKTLFFRHPVFVKKVGKSSLGKGVEKIDLTNIIKKNDINTLLKVIQTWQSEEEDLLLEELVIQSKQLAAFNQSSVNTIRIITYNTRSGIVAPFTFLKTGKGGSFVDNGGAGGILIGIDGKTGELNTNGIDEKGIIILSILIQELLLKDLYFQTGPTQ